MILRSETDKDDKRKARPEGKTLGRYVPMDKRLTEMYENYLIYHRPKSKGSEHISYLFVTHNHKIKQNKAISLAQINKIFREISEVVGFWVYPHALRHSWNDRYSENADKRIASQKLQKLNLKLTEENFRGGLITQKWLNVTVSAMRTDKQ